MTTPTQESVRKDTRQPVERVACRIYLDADQNDINGNGWNLVLLNTATYDLGLSFEPLTHRFTVPVTGQYSIKGRVHLVGSSVIADKRYTVAVYKNGVAVSNGTAHASYAGQLSIDVNDEFYLNKNDYIELYIYPNVGAVNTVDILGGSGYTYLVIDLITKEGTRQ